jgi:hypothetical protein
MTTGQESPQSVSFVGYYKGYSATITVRDTEVDAKALVNKAIEGIDYMVEKEFVPSWNSDTNKAHQSGTEERKQIPGEGAINRPTKCQTCGADATERSGIGKTTGKPYHGIFCSTGDKSHNRFF